MSQTEVRVGVDIGGTKAEIALVAGGRVLTSHRVPTGRQPADALVEAVAAGVRALAESGGGPAPAGVGVGVAGRVDPRSGVVRHAANLGWVDYPLQERLRELLSLPVAVLNDVQAAALAESAFGAGRGAPSMVALFVGTGIGGGMVERGTLLRGCSGSAGEWGHSVVELNGPPCHCGNHGCLETFAAGWGIAHRAREAVTREPEAGARLLELARSDPERLTTRMVAEAALAGDPLALALLADAGEALGAGLATIYNALDPCTIVLGGGVVEGYPPLLEMAASRARARLATATSAFPPVVRAGLGVLAGVIGAAEWVRQSQEH